MRHERYEQFRQRPMGNSFVYVDVSRYEAVKAV